MSAREDFSRGALLERRPARVKIEPRVGAPGVGVIVTIRHLVSWTWKQIESGYWVPVDEFDVMSTARRRVHMREVVAFAVRRIEERALRQAEARWTGPRDGDWSSIASGSLRAPVPPERWPYGPPSHHQRACSLFGRGLFCDCRASDASDVDHGATP